MRWRGEMGGVVRGLVMACALGAGGAPALAQEGTPSGPVGVAPEEEEPERPDVQAMADVGGVLTPAGTVVIEPSLQYSNSQVNRFTFQGVEILPTFLVGIIEVEDVDRDVWTSAVDVRMGLTPRLEFGLKVPYVYRSERRSVSIPQVDNSTTSQRLDGDGVGDVEASLHYQLNRGSAGGPFYIGNLRYKSITGRGPFEVDHNDSAVETEAATGSGFHALELSITGLVVSDPAVLYGNIGYLRNFPRDVDRTIGAGDQALDIGRVEPGDALRMSLGTSVSLNPRTSFSIGYKHDVIRPTRTEINNTTFESDSLGVGSLLLGVSHVVSPRVTASVNLEVGVTADAPDMAITFRMPWTVLQ
ncbi:transporter [Aquisalimonas lutea]|uniref:transporter n=1 Tax=Aquisalimonas lutea TaxID=1327750 RepID=UPI0025B5400F|nr:transporter [Aquisalimonas lutea]MDN3516980.1 transporter [Aquisalimonas lutea]